MLGAVCFLICMLALFAGMEVRSPGTLQAIVEAVTLTWMAASQNLDGDICAKFVDLGRPLAACSGL